MSAPPISSVASGDSDLDLESMFQATLSLAREVTKGAILNYCDAPLEEHNISLTAQQILAGDTRHRALLFMNDSSPAANPNLSADQMAQNGSGVDSPCSGVPTRAQPSFQPAMMGQMASLSSINDAARTSLHFQSANSYRAFTNANFQPQSSFNATRNQPELPQVMPLIQAANSHTRQLQQPFSSYPSISDNNFHSLSANQQHRPQLQQASLAAATPPTMDNIFTRTNDFLARQTTQPMKRINAQQQVVTNLQQGYGNPVNRIYLNSGQGSSLQSARPYNLTLPTLAPAQRPQHSENLLIVESRSTTQSRSGTPQGFEMAKDNTKSKKRKVLTDAEKAVQKARKKAKASKSDKADKSMLEKDKAQYNVPEMIWLRILEFCPPIFLRKARLISKEWKSWVDGFQSIHINCRKENFGFDLPEEIPGLTPQQYVDLLGGKGCMEPRCKNREATRTHWAWKKRWCLQCWKAKIEREDRIQKHNQLSYTRNVMDKLLECIPVGMYDSFGKPHDYVEDGAQPPGNQAATHRLYKYYLLADVTRIIAEYEALTPEPYHEDPTHDAQQKATARQVWDDKMARLDEDRDKFFEAQKAGNQEIMQLVLRIEAAIREKRAKCRKPNDANRESRRSLFLMSAKRDLPEVPEEFVQSCKAFKAACRIFRDGGSDRGWRTLMPKIQAEFVKEQQAKQKATETVSNTSSQVNSDQDIQMANHLANFDMDNNNFPQLGGHDLQRSAPQNIQGLPISNLSNAFANDSLDFTSFGSASRSSMATTNVQHSGRLMPSNRGMNINASSSFMSNTSSLNNGSYHGSYNSNNGISSSFFGSVSRNNNTPAINSMSIAPRNNNGYSANSMFTLQNGSNGSSTRLPSSVPHFNNGFVTGPSTQLTRNDSGMSMVSSNPSGYPSRNNVGTFDGSSGLVAHNSDGSTPVPANSSNLGSSFTSGNAMSIASLITRTQSQGY